MRFLNIFFFLFSFFAFAQTESDVKGLIKLYQEEPVDHKKVKLYLKSKPELRQLLELHRINTINSEKHITNNYIDHELDFLLDLIDEDLFDTILNFYWSIVNSEKVKSATDRIADRFKEETMKLDATVKRELNAK